MPSRPKEVFIKDGIICLEYKEAATQLVHIQSVVLSSIRMMVLKEVHNNLGHFGVKKTLGHVKTRFYWPGYKHAVESWVKQCE